MRRTLVSVLLALCTMPSAFAISDYDMCVIDLSSEYLRKSRKDYPVWNEIYLQMYNKRLREWENLGNQTIGLELVGKVHSCSINGVTYKGTHECLEGEKVKGCWSQECYAYQHPDNHLDLEDDARDEFIKRLCRNPAPAEKENLSTTGERVQMVISSHSTSISNNEGTIISSNTTVRDKDGNVISSSSNKSGGTTSGSVATQNKSSPSPAEMVAAARERENQPISGRFIGQKFKSAQISLYSCRESGESFAVNSDGTFSRKITNPSNSTKGYIIYPKVGGGTECVPVTIGPDGDVGEIVVEASGTKQENSSQPANETKQIKICLKYENGKPYKRNDMLYTVEINPVGSSKRYLHSEDADRNGCFTADIPNTEQKVNVKVSRGVTFDSVNVGLRNPVAVPRDGNLGTYTVQSSKEREAEIEAKEKSSAEKECAGKSGWEVKKEKGKWACIEKKQKQPSAQERRDAQKKCDEAGLEQEAKFENGEWKCVPTDETREKEEAQKDCATREIGEPGVEYEVVKTKGKWVCQKTKEQNKADKQADKQAQKNQQEICDKNDMAEKAEMVDGEWKCVPTDETREKEEAQKDCATREIGEPGVEYEVVKTKGKWVCQKTKEQNKADKQADKDKEKAEKKSQRQTDEQTKCDYFQRGLDAKEVSPGIWKCVETERTEVLKSKVSCGNGEEVVEADVGWDCADTKETKKAKKQAEKDDKKAEKEQQKICDKNGLGEEAKKNAQGEWVCEPGEDTQAIQDARAECESKPTPDDWVVEKDKSGNWACVQTKNSTKKEEKRAECSEKRMGVEKKGLLWACVDDANITSMWDDLDALEKALSDKLIELKNAAAAAEKQATESGNGEQGTPGEGDK